MIKAKTKKSKTPRPFRECVFPLLFDYGVDNVGANIDYLFDLRGEKCELLKRAESIIWQGGKDRTRTNLREFLKKYSEVEGYKVSRENIISFTKDIMIEWIEKRTDVKKDFEKEFGVSRTREELIVWVEEKKVEKELTKRVLEKWEKIETEIQTQRKSKYSRP